MVKKSRPIWKHPQSLVLRIFSNYEPNAIVLDRITIGADLWWERESIITMATSIKLLVEVVSTNWRDDYLVKFAEYESLGIAEYWIADYAGWGGTALSGCSQAADSDDL